MKKNSDKRISDFFEIARLDYRDKFLGGSPGGVGGGGAGSYGTGASGETGISINCPTSPSATDELPTLTSSIC